MDDPEGGRGMYTQVHPASESQVTTFPIGNED